MADVTVLSFVDSFLTAADPATALAILVTRTTGSGTGGTLSMVGANNNAGSITTDGSDDSQGGSIDTRGRAAGGGSIDISGGEASGGSIIAYGSTSTGSTGGTLDMHAEGSPGGGIDTSDGGGSINTKGTGLIELGVSGTRTSFAGTATTDRTINTPDLSGTLAVSGSGWVANDDGGDRGYIIPGTSVVVNAGATLDILAPGAGTVLIAVAEKLKAIQLAMANHELPNA